MGSGVGVKGLPRGSGHRGIRAYHKNFFAYDFSTDMYNLIHILRQEIEIGHILAKKGIKF